LSTSYIAIGCDSSKGRIDVEIRNNHGTVLHTGIFDDTPDDHAAVRHLVDSLRERHPEATFLVGIESTGGMERNWLAFFRHEKRWTKSMRVFKLNASSVHAYRSSQLHRAPGDAAAASDIACFLLERCCTRTPATEADSGPIIFYRMIRALIGEKICASQRLQTLLVAAHPDLVRFCRYGLPDWIMLLLESYPTAAQLARARVATVDAIPHIDTNRAEELIVHARQSVASLTDAAAAATIRLLVRRISDTNKRIDQAQAELLSIITADPQSPLAKAVALLDGIPGIGTWSAACLACEIGDPARFAHSNSIVAWAGLDPVTEASGDEIHNLGISHRGNAYVRAMLFPLAMAGIQYNPVLKAFYERLTATNGKTKLAALVAVMAKILRIAHALLLSNTAFDPHHEATRQKRAQAAQAKRATVPAAPSAPPQAPRLEAPISRREATKRKKAAAPGANVRDQSPRRITGREPHPKNHHELPPAKG
jgi:transposase